MLFTNFGQLVVLALVLIVGLSFGWAMHPGGKKWRRRYDGIVDSSNAYRAEIAGQLREAESRATALERDNSALQQKLDDAETRAARVDVGGIGPAAASLAAAPVVAEVIAPEPEPVAPEPEAIVDAPAETIAPVETVAEEDAAPATPSADAAVTETTTETVEDAEFTPVEDEATPAAAEAEAAPVETAEVIPAPETTSAETVEALPADEIAPETASEPAPEPEKRGWLGFGGPPREDDLGQLRGVDANLKTKLSDLGVHRYTDITGLSAEDEMALEQRLGIPAGYITREQWRDQAALLADGNTADHAERFGAET
jgi:predicted flap endonuclease-1-like 5' DNA nuclease